MSFGVGARELWVRDPQPYMPMPDLSPRLLRTILFLPLALAAAAATAQVPSGLEARSYDGTGNNREHADWGAAGSWMINRCRPGFADGLSAPGGAERANPRAISNAVFAQDGDRFGDGRLNDLWWAFGQLLDHDITLTHDGPDEFFGVRVPVGDPDFDPDSTGAAMLPMMRSAAQRDTTGLRRFANEVTAFVDASNVYGSDRERAAWLRSFSGGRLRTSAGDLPPFNTVTGEHDAPVDTLAPHVDGLRHPGQRAFVCGDARANENSLLASLHALWVREHNRLADSLSAASPGAGDEDVYQHARRLVAAQLQHITYAEWLPAIGVDLGAYPGYDPAVDPAIANEFAAAAFRFGHTLVGSELWLAGPDGELLPESPLALRDVFFDPVAVVRGDGVSALLGGAARHRQQALDCAVVTDLRSFLFGAPGAGGLDLAAVNIQRGRDRGLAGFNDLRRDLGLRPYASLGQLTRDAALAGRLGAVYAGTEDVDAWVGILAEGAVGGAIGETLAYVLREQFGRLRAGDRFFYARDPGLSGAERAWVGRQTLAAVIARNTAAAVGRESFRVDDDATAATALAGAGDASGVSLGWWGGYATAAGLTPGEAATLVVRDVVGRELTRGELRADGFGASRLPVSVPAGRTLVLSVERAGERAIPGVLAVSR